jgi:hypothetical protein
MPSFEVGTSKYAYDLEVPIRRPNTTKMIVSRRMRCIGHVGVMDRMNNVHKIVFGKNEWKTIWRW